MKNYPALGLLMARETEKVTVTYEKEMIIRVTCDWCGEPVLREYGYATRDFSLRFASGSNYGHDGGLEKGWEVEDLCDDCVYKLKALLEENGVTVKPVESDW